MIPKRIHYCWFGRNPKPKLAENCINSWKKYCKGYELIEWNEDNFDLASAPLYVRQAYEAKKWAFVTDYVRLWAMVNYGGVYMDTDVEVIKPLDSFLVHKAFSGFENERDIPTGIMACEKNFPLFYDFLHYYDDVDLYYNGHIQYITNVKIITDICKRKGLVQNNELQVIEDFVLYPKDYFCPISYITNQLHKTNNTVTIHWFAGSWMPKEGKEKHKVQVKRIRRINALHSFTHIPNRIIIKVLGDEQYEKVKKRIKSKKCN